MDMSKYVRKPVVDQTAEVNSQTMAENDTKSTRSGSVSPHHVQGAPVSPVRDVSSSPQHSQYTQDSRHTPPHGLVGTGAICSAFSEAQVSRIKLASIGSQRTSESPDVSIEENCRMKTDIRKSHSRTGSENSELEAALDTDSGVCSKSIPRAASPVDFGGYSPESPPVFSENSTRSSGGSGRSSNALKGSRDDVKGRYTPPSSIGSRSRSNTSSDKKKKASNWYNVLSPSYKSRSEDFKRLFKEIPNDERLIVDYSCALQKDILVHGRLYVTQEWICFYANIFRWETVLTIRCKDITAITKEKTARVIPNAIQICTEHEKYFLTSFATRDKSFLMLFRVWQNALMDQPMNQQELWQWVHYCYGDELGLTSSDEDYVAPTQDDELKIHEKLSPDEVGGSFVEEQEPDDLPDSSLINDPPLIAAAPLFENRTMATASAENEMPLAAAAAEGKHRKTIPPSTLAMPSPDATSGDVPTDMGDTTEDSEEVTCSGHEHTGVQYVDMVFNMSVDQMYNTMFVQNAFMDTLRRERKTFDSNIPPWPDEVSPGGNNERMLTYTLTSAFSFGPRHIPSEEKQILYGDSKPGQQYVIDSECVQLGIPYGDSFYVINRYCIMRVARNKCRLKVTSDLRYKKSVWGLVKSIIVRNATTGLTDYFKHLTQNLQKECDKYTETAAATAPRKKVLRRRRMHSTTTERTPSVKRPVESLSTQIQGSPAKGPAPTEEWHMNFSMDTLVRVMCIVLILLVMFNALLFYKLLSLERKADLAHYRSRDHVFSYKSVPKSHEDWVRLLDQQHHIHTAEMERWKQVLDASIQLVDQMRKTLGHLHDSIDIPPSSANQKKPYH